MTVTTTVENGIGTVTLEAPPLNILTRAVLAEIREATARLAKEPDLRVLRLAAKGKNFSAGADVGEHLPPQHAEMIPEFAETIEAVASFPLPVIAGVRGRCLGGGFELAQAADVIVAGEGSSFGQPEILLGVTAPAACVLLPRRAPYGEAAAMLFTGDPVPAVRAKAIGFVHALVSEETVDTETMTMAKRIARHSAVALRETKRALREAAAMSRAEALRWTARAYVDDLMKSHDAVEGLQAFLDKRAAEWRHR